MMHSPVHPGLLVKEMLDQLPVSRAQVGLALGLTQPHLSELLQGRRNLTPRMALRLGAAFPNTTPEFWLTCQSNYELARMRRTYPVLDVPVLWDPTTQGNA